MPRNLKRGAIPTPAHELAAATPFVPSFAVEEIPPNCLYRPRQISMWNNDHHGCCVTAEEAFAKACHVPEIFITDAEVERWATSRGWFENGAPISGVLQEMQRNGFQQDQNTYCDGAPSNVDFKDVTSLLNAIASGPVKIGLAAHQLEAVCQADKSGWFAVGFTNDPNMDHCVSLCGYGTIDWLAQQLNATVPSNVDGTQLGYAMFTWDGIGIIDVPSLVAITYEAWSRTPTTRIVPGKANMATLFPGQALDPGQSMQSDNKLHTLIMQPDGNVVLYDQRNQPLWATNTGGRITPGRFIMQTDGNLVLYDSNGKPRWASNTCNSPGAFLNVQDDGNLVVYRAGSQTETADNALWASGSNDIWASRSKDIAPRERDGITIAKCA